MMRDKQRTPLSSREADPDTSCSESDDEAFCRELSMAKFATDTSLLSKQPPAETQIPTGSSSRQRTRRRPSNFEDSENEERDCGFGGNAFSSGDPFTSTDSGDWATGFGASSAKDTKRASVSGALTDGNNVFALDPNEAFSKGGTMSPRRHSTLGASGFVSADCNDINMDVSFKGDRDSSKKSKSGRRHSITTGEIALNGIPEAFVPAQADIPAILGTRPTVGQRKPSIRTLKANNPLLAIPDPISGHKTGFEDDEGSMGDFSDDGTIDWEEGGAIVSKAKKYNGNDSKADLHSSYASSLDSKSSHLENGLSQLHGSASRGSMSIGSRNGSGRRRLHDLERRIGRKIVADDELTTATPRTISSELSGASSSTCPSLRSTNRRRRSDKPRASVELKTGSLLNDLVLIMDGKMDIPGGNEEDNKGQQQNRRRRSIKNDIPGDSDDPFVVRREVRGEGMKAFAENRTNSSKDLKSDRRAPPDRKAPSRSKSSKA